LPTSGATEDIALQVAQIQAASQDSLESVKSITLGVQGMTTRLSTIAESAGGQELSIREVVSALGLCTTGLGELREALGSLKRGTTTGSERVHQIRDLFNQATAAPDTGSLDRPREEECGRRGG
jgi:methyl-accepting chemotaxis protein